MRFQAMVAKNSVVVDYTKEENIKLILPGLPSFSSQKSELVGMGIVHYYHNHPFHETPKHSHPHHVLLIQFNNLERMRLQIDEHHHDRSFTSGKIFFTPANLDHAAILADGSEFLILDLEPTFIARSIYELIDPDLVELVPHISYSDPLIDLIGLTLKEELIKPGLASHLYVESLFTVLSIHLLRHNGTSQLTIHQYRDGLSHRQLYQVIDFIHANLKRKLTLSAIAQQLNMSVYYFCQLFKQSMGISPYKYVLQQRVEQAKLLLKHKEKAIADIALECGFANQTHLNKHFRKLTGTTPKSYRQR
jgi:AraC family transcriptional regulator